MDWWKKLCGQLTDMKYIGTHAVTSTIYVPKITEKGKKFLSEYNYIEEEDKYDMDIKL